MVTKETVLEDDQRILFSKTHIRAGGPRHNAKCKLYRPQGSHPIHHLSYFVYVCTIHDTSSCLLIVNSNVDVSQPGPFITSQHMLEEDTKTVVCSSIKLRGRVRAMHASSASRNLATEIDELTRSPRQRGRPPCSPDEGRNQHALRDASQSYHSKTFPIVILLSSIV